MTPTTLRARNGVAIRTSPTEGQRRQSAPCQRCGQRVTFYAAPRLVLCASDWRAFWGARAAIIRERLAEAYPTGRAHPGYLQAEARLRNNDRSIPDTDILARLGWAV